MSLKNIIKEIEKLNSDAFVLPVVKGRDEADFALLRENGMFVVGESKAQEFIKHYSEYSDFKWHFIGQLQTNKVKYVIGKCELIHSLDRLSLAVEINRLSKKSGIVTNCLVQLNFGNQTHRGGLDISNLADNAGLLSVNAIVSSGIQIVTQFLSDISQLSNIKVKGLMAVMPLTDFETLEIYYKALQLIFDYFKGSQANLYENKPTQQGYVKSVLAENNTAQDTQPTGESNQRNALNQPQFEILSAGMSGDYKLALKYGSNLVRLGKILFE